jgi:TetR/AcrR family transcriptional repressor of nem operon
MPRPRAFDPDDALEQAMRLFWEKGYEASSIQELERRMGINRFSIYNTFGDKEQLFLASIERYRKQMASAMVEAADGDSLEAALDFFRALDLVVASPEGAMGCLLVNTAVDQALRGTPSAAMAREHFDLLEASFHRTLRRARRSGELGGTDNLRDRARLLVAAAQGILVSARLGRNNRAARGAIRFTFREIDSWRALA